MFKKAALFLLLALPLAAYAGDAKPVRLALSIGVVGLGIADTALTIHGTSKLGLVEANGVLRRLFEKRQYAAVWGIQAIGTFAIVGAGNLLIAQDDKTAKFAGYAILVTAFLFRSYLVIHNASLNHRAAKSM